MDMMQEREAKCNVEASVTGNLREEESAVEQARSSGGRKDFMNPPLLLMKYLVPALEAFRHEQASDRRNLPNSAKSVMMALSHRLFVVLIEYCNVRRLVCSLVAAKMEVVK